MRILALLGVLLVPALAAAIDRGTCTESAGDAATACLKQWLAVVEDCRARQDPACETAARANGGPLKAALAAANTASTLQCDAPTAVQLGYQTLADVGLRTTDACGDWGEAFLDLAWSDAAGLNANALICQRVVAKSLGRLRKGVIAAFGDGCYAREARDRTCKRSTRDRAVHRAKADARRRINKACRTQYASLGLDPVETLLDRGTTLARHFAQQTYPPNDLGPTAELGEHPVGIRTIQLADAARSNVQGNGPRPVTAEIYYPTTAAAIAGVPNDKAKVLGVEVATLPAWRDVPVRTGTYPLIVFSHGNNGLRIQSFFFAAHLASHGFIVVSPDHHGNTFVDTLAQPPLIDPMVGANRPLDMTFLIDEMLAMNGDTGSFLHGSIDPDRIGASGHSFGGYTTWTLGGPAFSFGSVTDTAFTDARVKALLPQAPFSPFNAAFYGAIHIPTLVVGGSIDETTPFPANQQAPFDALPSGGAFVALAQLTDAGHFTFSDFCEVDRALLGFLGGFAEACEPRHLPFRHAHDIVNYLSLNFFDGVLNGNADALARLEPAVVGAIEDLTYTRK